eukprot:s380_g9.t1
MQQEERSSPSLKGALAQCTSMSGFGCLLAWWLVTPRRWESADAFTRGIFASLLEMHVARAQSSLRKKGATFPFQTGELDEFIFHFKKITLEEATATDNVALWCRQAWLFLMMMALNVLGGAAAELQPGRLTSSERQSARSLSGAVSRRLDKDIQEAPLTESAWQKEMVSKQVGYSGEEVTTCHQLTWDQVESSLPPGNHGGAIDALDWVGCRTREFLLEPAKLLKPPHEVVLPRNALDDWAAHAEQEAFANHGRALGFCPTVQATRDGTFSTGLEDGVEQ